MQTLNITVCVVLCMCVTIKREFIQIIHFHLQYFHFQVLFIGSTAFVYTERFHSALERADHEEYLFSGS